MGKNKDKKKKGHGMEKTLAKTEKKNDKRLKKELEEIGEVFIFNVSLNVYPFRVYQSFSKRHRAQVLKLMITKTFCVSSTGKY